MRISLCGDVCASLCLPCRVCGLHTYVRIMAVCAKTGRPPCVVDRGVIVYRALQNSTEQGCCRSIKWTENCEIFLRTLMYTIDICWGSILYGLWMRVTCRFYGQHWIIWGMERMWRVWHISKQALIQQNHNSSSEIVIPHGYVQDSDATGQQEIDPIIKKNILVLYNSIFYYLSSRWSVNKLWQYNTTFYCKNLHCEMSEKRRQWGRSKYW